jgi:hypothetical protein
VSVSHYLLGGDMAAPALMNRPVKRFASITPGRILSPVIDLALIIAGMALGAQVKKISPVKNPHLMNGVQAAVGLGGSLMVKNRFARMPLIGIALQSAIAEAKILMPKMIPLAGDDEVMYLPVGEDDEEQIEMRGTDERVGAVVVGQDEEMEGSDERVGAVVVGDDDEGEGMSGEGENA